MKRYIYIRDGDVLRMAGVADLIERINQGVLVVWLECDAQVDGRSRRRMALAFPLFRNRVP
jgi:hypothetical protein